MKHSLNHAYRLVWNEAIGAYVAVAETTRSRGKRASGAVLAAATGLTLALAAQSAAAVGASTLPSNATVAAGSATLTQSGNALNVAQSSQKLVINWGSFDIGSAASVNFNQASKNDIALNRVTSGTASQIDGALTANGNVWVLNSAGVVFGNTARVNVGGLVASSLNLSDSDFLAGNYTFTNGGSAGAVRNAGSIAAAGGVVALIAPVVSNTGSIAASTVAMAAGDQVTLDFSGDGLLGYTIDSATLGALVENDGSISGNTVSLSARSANQAVATVVNNEGVIEATGLSTNGGHIVLDGGDNGAVHVSGTLDASSTSANGGAITVTGNAIALDGGATLNANGATGGGTIKVGGGLHGEDTSVANAQTVDADSTVTANANATAAGNGGNVVFWSDDTTTFGGNINIRGGAQSGAGGQAEVSGKQLLNYTGVTNASAAHGAAGDLLLDPATLTIEGGSGTDASDGSVLYAANIEAQAANVNLTATGNINIGDLNQNGGDGTLTLGTNYSLRLEAGTSSYGYIGFANSSNTIAVSGTGSIYMQAGLTGTGGIGNSAAVGYTQGVANLVASGAGVSAATGGLVNGISAVGAGSPQAGSITLFGADGITTGGTITTNGGYVRIWGDSDNGGGGGLTLSSAISTNGGNLYLSTGTSPVEMDSDMILGAGRITFRYDGTNTSGTKILNGLLSTTGDVDIDTDFTMGGNASIYASGNINFGAVNLTLNTGTGVLVLRANAIDFGSATLTNLSTASIRLEPYDPSTNMVLGDASGFASAATLAALPGIQNLTIGRPDGTGTITVSSAFGFDAWGSFELEDRTVNVAAALTNTTGNVTLTSDNVSITDTVTASTSTGNNHAAGTAGAGKVTIRQMTAADDLLLGSGLNSSSVGEIDAATLELGRTDGGDLVFNSDITTSATSVALLSAGQVLGVAGGVSAANLAVVAGGGATISSPTFDFTTLALVTGANSTSAVTSTNANWALGTVDGYTGLNLGAGSTTTLKAAGTLGLNGGSVNFNGGATALNLDADAFAGTAAVSNQAAGSVAFDQVDHGTALTVGAVGSVLPGTTLASFNGTKDITVGSAQADVVAQAALAVTTAAGGTLTLVGDTLSLPDAITVTTGGLDLESGSALALNAALTANSGTVTLHTDDQAITGSGVITANGLVIDSGTGDATLSATQQVNTLSADAGALSLKNGKSLVVDGIAVDKTVDLRLSGATADLTLAGAVTAANSGSADTAILLAAGRNFVNDAGSTAVAATSGRWLVYSTSPLADTRGGLTPDFKQYDATLSDTVLGSGNGFLYTVAPTVTVSLVGTTSKVYDGTQDATLTAGNYATSGAIDGDAVTFSAGSASYDTKNAGTGKTVTASDVALTGASNGGIAVYGYTLSNPTASGAIGTVTPRTITTGAVEVETKTYDGTTAATLDGTLAGTVSGDDVSVSGSAAFSDKNAGIGKTVSLSDLALSGGDAGNYVLASASGTSSGDITAKTITAGTVAVTAKTYDGTTVADLTGGALSGAVAGDDVATTLAGNYADKNAGTDKAVTVSVGLAGADAGNYVLASTSSTSSGDIEAKTITAGAVTVATKVYGGTTTANVSGGALSGVVAGDDVTTTLSGTYDNAAVGSGKTVTVQLGLAGSDAANYQLSTTQETASGSIAANPSSNVVAAVEASTGSTNGTNPDTGGNAGGSSGNRSTLLPGASGQAELYGSGDAGTGIGTGSGSGSGSGSGNGTGTSSGNGAGSGTSGTGGASQGGGASGSASSDLAPGAASGDASRAAGVASTSGNAGASGDAGAGSGSAGTGASSAQGGSGLTTPAVQLSTEGEFHTADGVSIDTAGNGGAGSNGSNGSGNGSNGDAAGSGNGSSDSTVRTSLTVYTADADQGLHVQGEYHVVDQGSSLSLQALSTREAGAQPQLDSGVSVRTQATLPLSNGGTALMQLTLLADGVLLVQGDASLGSMSQDTLSAYALSALKASAGISVDKVKAVVLRIGTKR